MGTSKLSQGQPLAAAGGAILVISLFLHWVPGQSAFDAFSSMHIVMLIVGLAAIWFGASPALGMDTRMPANAAWIVAALGVAVFGWTIGFELEISGAVGVWIGLLASIAIAYGGYEAATAPAHPRATAPSPPATPAPSGPPAV